MTFLMPMFLAGLAALSVPLILHLMHRPIPRRIVFPTIRFIRKGQEYQAGRRGLRDLLTLLLRLLAITALVLIFAKPAFPRQAVGGAVAGQEHLVMVYDISASMHLANFDRIRQRTAELLDEAADDARIALLVSSDHLVKAVPFTGDKAAIEAAIADLEPTLLPGLHNEMQQRLHQYLVESEGAEARVYLFSDLQQADWGGVQLTPEGMNDVPILFERPYENAPPNLAIIGVRPEIFDNEGSRQLRATVRVRNFSVEPGKATLRLRAGSRQTEMPIELGAEASSSFVVDMSDPGDATCVAELVVDEAYDLDNRYHFWVGRNPPIKAGIVIPGKTGESIIQAFFLRQALETRAPGAVLFEVATLEPEFIYEGDLRQYQVLFYLDSMGDYSLIEYEMLRDYLNSGGVMVYFAGPKAPETFVNFKRSELSSIRFNGWIGDLNRLQSLFISNIDAQSPVLEPFARQDGDLTVIPIYRMARFELPEGAHALATADARYPLLAEERVGEGRLFAVATSLNPRWSELPTSLSFLPLMRRLAAAGIGEDYRRVVSLEVGRNPVQALAAAGLPVRAEVKPEPGVYLVEGIPIEVNITRAESDFRTAETFELLQAAQLDPSLAAGAAEDEPDGHESKPLVGYLALLLMLVLAGEIVIANYRVS